MLSPVFADWGFSAISINSTVVFEIAELQEAVRTLGLEAATFGIRRAEDIVPAFETLKSRTDALYVAGDPIVLTNGVRSGRATADDLWWPGVRHKGRPDVLWAKLPGPV